MPNQTPDELKDWPDIEALSSSQMVGNKERAYTKAMQKQVLAMTNLGQNVLTAQKHISKRLDDLNAKIHEQTKASNKMSKKTFWLTIALVVATIVQAVAATLMVYFAAKSK